MTDDIPLNSAERESPKVTKSSSGSEVADELAKNSAALEKSIKALQNTIDSDLESLGRACDDFTHAAKSVAATALQERVRRSFLETIDDEGKSVESLEEKTAHIDQVKNWLTPWNLEFATDSDKPMRLMVNKAGNTTRGTFRLRPYATADGEQKAVSQWAIIREILCSPKLVDVTEISRRKTGRSS